MMNKDPVTDPGKKSKEGFLSVEKREDGSYAVVVAETLEAYAKNLEKSEMLTYYDDGRLTRFDSLDEMRSRAGAWARPTGLARIRWWWRTTCASASGSCQTAFRAHKSG